MVLFLLLTSCGAEKDPPLAIFDVTGTWETDKTGGLWTVERR